MSLREKKTAKRKEEILKSALSLLAEKGYHGTTMEDIASHLLMTKGSIYYYFKDKQDLVYQSQVKILQKSIENINEVKQQNLTIPEKLETTVALHIEYAVRDRAGFELMANPSEIFSEDQLKEIFYLRDKYASGYDELLQEGVDTGYFSVDDIKVVRNILLGAMNWVTQWYSADGEMNEATFAASVASYLMRIVLK